MNKLIIILFGDLIVLSYKPRKKTSVVYPTKIDLSYKLSKIDAG